MKDKFGPDRDYSQDQPRSLLNEIKERELFSLTSAKGGNEQERGLMRRFFVQRPVLAAIIGDIGGQAHRAWLDWLNRLDPLVANALEIQLPELKRQLAGPATNALERVMIDRVVSDLLHVAVLEIRLTQDGRRLMGQHENITPLETSFEMAHRRLMNSVRSLAVVQRLAASLQRSADFPSRPTLAATAAQNPESLGGRQSLIGEFTPNCCRAGRGQCQTSRTSSRLIWPRPFEIGKGHVRRACARRWNLFGGSSIPTDPSTAPGARRFVSLPIELTLGWTCRRAACDSVSSPPV